MYLLKLEPLSKAAFAPFGEVIQAEGSDWYPINNGTTRRYHQLASVQLIGEGARAGISLAHGGGRTYPIMINMLERHPLGSQSWIPLNQVSFIAVVAPNGADDKPDESGLRAFLVQGDQGVNYYSGTWHHPLITLGQGGEFIVVDRIDSAPNCDEAPLSRSYLIDGS
ncbi:ureidoglycolate lyase [Candidimonas sp. SYP-B2681]|uniref:ureidoglycolate lyase n=1 Tax=Candidimonas sp. SYP-B2681 TaxID=2497686 RepID=UPI000F880C1E|nr:ureidoglycolate lyase [Candidimonas sp. SYP-B2681]RTZ41056.1 ureidoglycolate lyase [Candidimonas sp. SYP-B2681]